MSILSKAIKNVMGTKQVDRNLGMSLERRGLSGFGSAYSHYRSSDYENAYPAISKIANAFMMVEPFTIDSNGKPVPSNVLDRFYSPNRQMSAADFREALAVMTSVHAKVYIRVHYRTTRLNQSTITGFTFLENVYEYTEQGKAIYQMPDATKFTEDEVVVLKGINPHNLSAGFSPTMSARKWINIDDYIAAYQSGFFENGAVPQGQFTIVAKTAREFNDIANNMESRHKGSGRNNGVSYIHQPVDPATDKPAQAQITWTPYNTNNKDLELKELFSQANNKIDSAFGVPASIRGVNERNTYASVRVDEVIFAKYVVDPLLMKTYSKLTHELNRITGGLGVAFSYKLSVPQLADEEKVKSAAKNTDLAIIRQATELGFSLDSIVTAFELSNGYKLLKTSGKPKIDNDKPEVLSEDELRDTPDQPREAVGELIAYPYKGTKATEQQGVTFTKRIEDVARRLLSQQIESAIKNTKAIGDPTEEQLKAFLTDTMLVIQEIMLIEGISQYEAGKILLVEHGIVAPIGDYVVSKEALARYREYLVNVGDSYSRDNQLAIQKALDFATEQGMPRADLEKQLRNILQTDDYRVTRLGVSETNRSLQIGSLEAMETIQIDADVKLGKIWNVSSSDPCEFCEAKNGTQVGLTETFVPVGGEIDGVDGGLMVNDFVDMDTSTAHPSCKCYLTYEVLS